MTAPDSQPPPPPADKPSRPGRDVDDKNGGDGKDNGGGKNGGHDGGRPAKPPRTMLDTPEKLLRDPGPNVKSLAWAVRMHRDGNLRGAANAYNEILKRHPDHPDVLHLMGLLLAEAGRHRRALDFLRQANALRPNDEAFCLSLGEVYRRANALPEALDALSRAATLNPNLAEAWVSLGNALSETGQFDDAIQVFREALEIRPESPKLLMALADALLVQDRLDDAAEAYKHVLVADPANADGYARLAATLVVSGREQAAATLFDHGLLLFAKPLRRVPGWSDIVAFNRRLAGWLHKAWCLDAGLPAPQDQAGDAAEPDALDTDPNDVAATDIVADPNAEDDGARPSRLAAHRQDALRASIIAAELENDGFDGDAAAAAPDDGSAPVDPDDDSALAVLDKALAGLAEAHVHAVADSGHPFGRLAPARWRLVNGKAMRPDDLADWRYGGAGWMSGLYIAATGGAPSDDGSRAGWLEFGPPTVDNGVAEQATRRVSPRDGLLLLFPSWFWHRLIPPKPVAADKWVALAFDLVAEAKEIPASGNPATSSPADAKPV